VSEVDRGAWRPDKAGVSQGGDIGGDIQASDSWAVRFVRDDQPAGPGSASLVTVTCYGTEDEENNPGEFGIVREVEYLICTDPDDPGGTELWSEYEYDDVFPDQDPRTAEEAGCLARDEAEAALNDAGELAWNGRPFRTDSTTGQTRELAWDDPAIGPTAQAWAAGHATEGDLMTTPLTGETNTHAAWRAWAGACITRLQGLAGLLDTMAAQIEADNGDLSQVAAIRVFQAQITDLVASGIRMTDAVNETQVPVGEAVAAAGGPENTPHKQYADEARTGR
jgi:hypothetical protein